jgi:hypothetical protein
MLPVARSAWLITTGPSIRPIVISGLPLVISINALSLTKSTWFMVLYSPFQSGDSKVESTSIKEESYDFFIVHLLVREKLYEFWRGVLKTLF